MMHRRPFLLSSILGLMMKQASANTLPSNRQRLEAAAACLQQSVASGQVRAGVIYASIGDERIEQAFGTATTESSFLLGSISKPICVAALMSLFDKQAFKLTDKVHEHLPEFKGDGRESVTIQHLLTHVSGLPDQLPNNAELRRSHAPLSTFVEAALKLPLNFAPGTRYEYSSMAILLATEIARRKSNIGLLQFVEESVLKPLDMQHSAIGLGALPFQSTVPVQTEHAAPEAGGGDPNAKSWDWNSRYWRELGAPWGGVHASAKDVAKFLSAFQEPKSNFLSPATLRLMISNHNPNQLPARGLGFALGPQLCKNCSESTFGHTGSTGTIAFIDPQRETTCVVLTSLPGQAVTPHPRDLTAECL